MTPERLKELLNYDRDTGEFSWKVSRGGKRANEIAGCRNAFGYIMIRADRKLHFAHRLAWLYVYGAPVPAIIDHINRNPADNRLCNLREATQQQNVFNAGIKSDNVSGVKHVHYDRARRKYAVTIRVNGKTQFKGRYATLEQAAERAKEVAKEIQGEFAVCR